MKVCPICKSRCFDDMDTCYGCLHNFTKVYDDEVFAYPETTTIEAPDSAITSDSTHAPEPTQIPEFFEIDSFPQIEDIDSCHLPQHSHDHLNGLSFNDSKQFNHEDKIKVSIEIPKSLLKTLTE